MASSFAGNLISNLVSSNRKWGRNAQSRSDVAEDGEIIESRIDDDDVDLEDVLTEVGEEEDLDDEFNPSQKIDNLSR